MSKKRSRNPAVVIKSKVIVISITIAALILTGMLMAQHNSLKALIKPAPSPSLATSPAVAPQSQPALSKEYIYAGGRLIATEESTAINGNDADFVSMSFPDGESISFGLPGQYYRVRVTMKNTGTTTWSIGAGYQLGSQNPANNITWGISRVPLPQPVPPNTQVTFEFSAVKPNNPPAGNYLNMQWQMAQDGGVGFFGEKTENRSISDAIWLPIGEPNSCQFLSQTVPSLMFAGLPHAVSITMNNNGSSAWTTTNNYKLGSQIPQDNTFWGTNRVALPSPGTVASGANVTFSFNATAPASAGTYNFQWQMVQDGGASFFGTLTAPVSVLNRTL